MSLDSESSFFASSSAKSCFFEPEESRYFCANANEMLKNWMKLQKYYN
jgi:hypothetical protein